MILKINHRISNDNGDKGIVTVKYFNSFNLNLKYDSVGSTFSFDFYFDPKNKSHAELACVSHYHEAIVEHNGRRLLTGFILSQAFKKSSVKNLVKITGYSKPGVLEDCEIPTSLYPLQTDGLSLTQITKRLIAPFRLELKVEDVASADASQGVQQKADATIKKSTASESKNIKSYITDLAAQRNINVTHDEYGRLVFTEAKVNQKPLFHIGDGGVPTDSIEMVFNGQGIHSHITIIKEADADGGNAGEYTIRNPYSPVAAVFRPKVINASSGDDITIEEAARRALADELKNISLVFTTDRWEIDGVPILPNNIITAYCPEVFLYRKTEWFIEEVNLVGDEKKTVATVKCVPPEVYSKKVPKNMFVDPHDNLPRF